MQEFRNKIQEIQEMQNKMKELPRKLEECSGKFSTNTPLVALLVEVYQQVSHWGILPKARQIRPRASLNKSQFYDYHKSYGHRIEDCINLKDALEQAI
ncbi:hypothetical protein Ahy_A10g049713 [Arachis hypogaea]|uniref:Uncharacterized protein n=1 Tax=Arachis hypogaea TaxID=3818 RepID=A0A445B7S1_ARAHY|nr:hypothetical protein Ahy_A10g049713 [Arachis hypogaea]